MLGVGCQNSGFPAAVPWNEETGDRHSARREGSEGSEDICRIGTENRPGRSHVSQMCLRVRYHGPEIASRNQRIVVVE